MHGLTGGTGAVGIDTGGERADEPETVRVHDPLEGRTEHVHGTREEQYDQEHETQRGALVSPDDGFQSGGKLRYPVSQPGRRPVHDVFGGSISVLGSALTSITGG